MGELYYICGNRSLPNLEGVDKQLGFTGKPGSLIEYVIDRPGHDRRHPLSSENIMRETGWRPVIPFEASLARTIEWYGTKRGWVARVQSAGCRACYEHNHNRSLVP